MYSQGYSLYFRRFWPAAIVFALSGPATAQIAILQIKVIEGEGAVHAPGSRGHPLTVEITDEVGKPVAAAAVSFHLPEEGPGGTFVNGLRTEVVTTDSHGHAALHGLQINHTSGKFLILIMASKEQARAGVASSQYVAETKGGTAPGATVRSVTKGRKWIAVAALVGGAAVATILGTAKSGAPASTTGTPAGPAASAPTIGTPSITVGKP